jgi:Papain-like cysteine protease AvrRpt2
VACTTLCSLANAQEFFVGIKREDFRSSYRAQRDPMWCWAAATEMVLDYKGMKYPHNEIVAKIKGAVVSAPGTYLEMIQATNLLMKKDGVTNIISGQMVMGAPTSFVVYNHLKRKNPIILTYKSGGSIGHAVVITGAVVTFSDSMVTIQKLEVFDPFSYSVINTSFEGPKWIVDTNKAEKTYRLWDVGGGNITLNATGESYLITGMILIDYSEK